MKDIIGNSISDDAEFDDLEDFDYVDQFGGQDDDDDDLSYSDDDYDDLDDLYVEEEDEDLDEFDDEDEDEFDDIDKEDDEDAEIVDDDMDDIGEELEVRIICDDCGHKWVDLVSETEEENDLLDLSCPMCGSSNVTTES